MKHSDWYHSLEQPKLSPPDWLFAPIWAFLYVTIFVSFMLLVLKDSNAPKSMPVTIFIIQFILNFIWAPVFFGLKNIGGALIINILLWLSVIGIIVTTYPISRAASLILIPYLVWVSFAVYLNARIFMLNR